MNEDDAPSHQRKSLRQYMSQFVLREDVASIPFRAKMEKNHGIVTFFVRTSIAIAMSIGTAKTMNDLVYGLSDDDGHNLNATAGGAIVMVLMVRTLDVIVIGTLTKIASTIVNDPVIVLMMAVQMS